MSGTNVTYNGVTLQNVLVSDWRQEMRMDESGTDYCYSRHHITFEGVLHAQGPSSNLRSVPAFILPDSVVYGGALSTPAIMAKVQYLLSQPRQTLAVTVNGQALFTCRPSSGGATIASTYVIKASLAFGETPSMPEVKAGGNADEDVDNGPKPKDVTIKQITADKVFHVSFTIECARVEFGQPSGNQSLQGVLNNRWSIEESMDANFFITRTIRGKMLLNSSVQSADIYRFVVVPPLERDFRREGMDFATQPNGLEVEYSITDKQIHWAPPWPATKMEGSHSAGVAVDGMNAIEDFYVKLDGPPDADKRDLLHQAIQIACLRLKLTGPNAATINTQWVPENFTFTEQFGEVNSVEVRARVRYTPDATTDYVFVANNNIGLPLQIPDFKGHKYDAGVSPVPALFGYDGKGVREPATTLLLRCYLQTPPGHHRIGTFPDADNNAAPPATYDYPITRYSPSSSYSSNAPQTYSNEAKAAPYTYAAMTVRYISDTSRLALAKGVSASSSSASSAGESADTAVVARLGGTRGMLEMKFEFERNGQMPSIPPPLDNIAFNDTLKGALVYQHVEPTAPGLNPGMGTRLFHITGVYRYALNRPPRSDENLSFGALPYTAFTAQNTTFKFGDIASAGLSLDLSGTNTTDTAGAQAIAPPAQQAAAQAALQKPPPPQGPGLGQLGLALAGNSVSGSSYGGATQFDTSPLMGRPLPGGKVGLVNVKLRPDVAAQANAALSAVSYLEEV